MLGTLTANHFKGPGRPSSEKNVLGRFLLAAGRKFLQVREMTTISEIYELVNSFRANPLHFHASCVGQPAANLTVDSLLEEAAKFQATHQCSPMSHLTCPEFCQQFRSCQFTDRVKYFTHGSSQNEYEILVQGPKRPFQPTLNSPGHCSILLRNDINAMGGHIFNHVFVLTVGFLVSRKSNSHNASPCNE